MKIRREEITGDALKLVAIVFLILWSIYLTILIVKQFQPFSENTNNVVNSRLFGVVDKQEKSIQLDVSIDKKLGEVLGGSVSGGDGATIGILGLVAIFAGLLSFIFKEIVQKTLIKENRAFVEAHIFKLSGVQMYHLYRSNQYEKRALLNWLNRGIELSEKGIAIAVKLSSMHKENNLVLCILRNNVAWFLREKLIFIREKFDGEEKRVLEDMVLKQKQYAFENAKYAFDKMSEHPEHSHVWRDTYEKVKYDFGIR